MSYTTEVLADAPIAFYPLDEPPGALDGTTALDASGNARHASYNTGTSGNLLSGEPPLHAGSTASARFGGAAPTSNLTYIRRPQEAWQNTDHMTAAAVVKLTAGPGGTILAHDAAGSNSAIAYRLIVNTDRTLGLFFKRSGQAIQSVTSTTPLTVGQTYHVAATYDGAAGRLFLDGVQIASTAGAGVLSKPTDTTNSGLLIGNIRSNSGGSGTVFPGWIDGAAFYGVALSPARIAAHALAALAVPAQPPTDLRQTAATLTGVTVAWAPPTGGPAPTGYQLRVDGGTALDVGNVTSWELVELLPATAYAVEVRAVAAGGTSAWVAVTATTATATAEWVSRPLVSHTLLATAGLDAEADQPAFQWHGYAGGWVLDDLRSRSLMGWQVTTGRPGPRDTVPPTSVTVTLAAWGAYAAAGLPQLGERFRLALAPALTALGIDAADLPRFTGEVTDVDLDTDKDVLTVTGVGRYARKSRLVVDATGAPVEREGARVARILAAIGAEAGTLDAGRSDLVAPAQPAPAAQLVEQIAASSTGQLVERRDGALDWHSADHRRDTPLAIALDATELLRGFRWTQRVGDLTNAADVSWAGGQLHVEDTASVDERERYPATFDTLLNRASMAQAIGGLVVGRYGRPVWLLPAVIVDITRTLRAADAGAAAALAHASRLQLLDLPPGGPYTTRAVFVEGVTETLTPRAWRLALTVADERLSGSPMRWRDVPAGVRWSDVTAGLRWLDVATIQDPADLT